MKDSKKQSSNPQVNKLSCSQELSSGAFKKEEDKSKKNQFFATNELFKKPKSLAQATDEQQKLMSIMRANFQQAKTHLLYQKEVLENALIQEEKRKQFEIQQNSLQSSIHLGQTNPPQKQMEFGVSAGKPSDHEDTALVNSIIGINEAELKRKGQENEFGTQAIENHYSSQQSQSLDNRIIFLAPETKENMRFQEILDVPNVMNHQSVLVEQSRKDPKLANKLISSQLSLNSMIHSKGQAQQSMLMVQQKSINTSQNMLRNSQNLQISQQLNFNSLSNTQELSPQHLQEKKASAQFKQFFKPMVWNAEAARNILESKSNSILNDTTQQFSPNKSGVNKANTLLTSYPIMTSQQNYSLPGSEQNSIAQPQYLHSSLYQKTMLKQMEESTQNPLDPRRVYVDFRGQAHVEPIVIEKTVHPPEKTLTQKQVDEMVRKQSDWLQQRDFKVLIKREKKEEEELNKCTFKPDLKSLTSSSKNIHSSNQTNQLTEPYKKTSSYSATHKSTRQNVQQLQNQTPKGGRGQAHLDNQKEEDEDEENYNFGLADEDAQEIAKELQQGPQDDS